MCCGLLTGMMQLFLFVSNVAVFIMSGVVLGLSAWALFTFTDLRDLLDLASDEARPHLLAAAPVVLLAVSAVLMVVACLGCCGAIKENRCCLIWYCAALGGFIFAYLSGAVLVSIGDVRSEIEKPLMDTLKRYDPASGAVDATAIVKGWDGAIKEFKCCGVNSYADWAAQDPSVFSDPVLVPRACCENLFDGNSSDLVVCLADPARFKNMAPMRGCVARVAEEAAKHRDAVAAGVGIALLVMAANLVSALLIIMDCCC